MTVPTLLITGTVGAGKSTVAAEINDVLALLEIPNAAVALDALVWQWPSWQWPSSSRWNEDLAFENLAALWPNYRSHGATHLVIARVLEQRDELDRYRTAIPGTEVKVVRLTASEELRRERLRARMPAGESRDWHLRRTAELDAVLDTGGSRISASITAIVPCGTLPSKSSIGQAGSHSSRCHRYSANRYWFTVYRSNRSTIALEAVHWCWASSIVARWLTSMRI